MDTNRAGKSATPLASLLALTLLGYYCMPNDLKLELDRACYPTLITLVAFPSIVSQVTAGELRRLRGPTRRAAFDALFEQMLSSPSVMMGVLEEMDAPNGRTSGGHAVSTIRNRKKGDTNVLNSINSAASDMSESESEDGKVEPDSVHAGLGSSENETSLSIETREGVRNGKKKMSRVRIQIERRKPTGPALGPGDRDNSEIEGDGSSSSHAKATATSPVKHVEPSSRPTDVRRAKWLEAVAENDSYFRAVQERLRKEGERAKEAHVARTKELMGWMVDEQNGRHDEMGSVGPPVCKDE